MHLSIGFYKASVAVLLATIASPLPITAALANELSVIESSAIGSEIAQASPTPTPAPATPESQGGFTPAPAPETAPSTRQAAPAATIPISERVDLIGACRQTNRTVEVFRDTALSPVNRVGTFAANTPVRLTGVIGTGRAQVYWPTTWPPSGTISVVGWVNSAFLTTCNNNPPPVTQACYQINTDFLTVRTAPSSTAAARGSLRAGTIATATTNPPTERTSPNAAPDFGRIWAEINFQGSPGWIARTGPNGVGNNATRLPDAQCSQ
ncbi:MAG: hypothetical protein Kow00121_59890 [Elainellaceae cyanobacterium]